MVSLLTYPWSSDRVHSEFWDKQQGYLELLKWQVGTNNYNQEIPTWVTFVISSVYSLRTFFPIEMPHW